MLDSVLTWLPLTVLAIANGAIREATYGKRVDELQAHQVSTGSFLLLLGLYTWLLQALWPLGSLAAAAARGAVWLVLTVAFELSFGRFVMKHSWERLLRDYDLRAGRVWSLVLVGTAVCPAAMWWLHGSSPGR